MAKSFKKAWVIVKNDEDWNDWQLCCGITPEQAIEQSWNFCPFCGEQIPAEIIDTYDFKM